MFLGFSEKFWDFLNVSGIWKGEEIQKHVSSSVPFNWVVLG